MNAPLLDARTLRYDYPDGTPALRGVDLRLTRGEAVAVVGANGAGKSTLLMLLAGLLTPAAGQLQLDGPPPAGRDAGRNPLLGRVGYVFQDADDQLFMPTVREDVAFGPLNQGLPPDQVRARVDQALQAVGALHLIDRAPYHLSGGEKRIVAIAGVLAMHPDLLVLDEPTAGLDPAARRRLIGLLQGFTPTRVVATHDLDLVLDLCERVVVLHEGRIAADGPARTLLRDADLLQRCRLEAPLRWQGTGATD